MSIELKRALQQQASTFEQDITNKMIYLQGDEDLGIDYYQYSAIISSQSSQRASPKKSENLTASEENQSDFQQRKDRIMARIEAIKGKSFPGSYLRTSSAAQ
ncbi:MAG: hypothetical protein J6Y53_04885 [Alphaproteobacteria bacterium]|nr:hypothetical protein [Alphaproteobacteria bacterium]